MTRVLGRIFMGRKVFLKKIRQPSFYNVLKVSLLVTLCTVLSCGTSKVKPEDEERLQVNEEFEQVVQIKEIEEESSPLAEEKESIEKESEQKKSQNTQEKKANAKEIAARELEKKRKAQAKKRAEEQRKKEREKKKKAALEKKSKDSKGKTKVLRLPEVEDDEGFSGRRPLVDPFRVGEKVKLEVSYFGAVAGVLTMEVLPFVEVNGKRSYRMKTSIETSDFFSLFYSVKDYAETFLDYDEMKPSTFRMMLNESKQKGNTKAFFDWEKGEVTFWEKRITTDHGLQERKLRWKLPPYTQNVYSAAFYMRVFQYHLGKELAFYVANKGKNVLFTGKVLRKEKLKTRIGVLDTVVIKPEFSVGGVFQPVGDIFFWLTDDERKFIVKIESKIRIGKLLAELIELDKGKEE